MKFIKDILNANKINYLTTDDGFILDNNKIISVFLLKQNSEYSNINIKKINKNYYHKYKNYNRLVFYEDEIKSKPDLVKSMILNLVNKNEFKIRASKLDYREFKPKEYKEFFNKNHIDGYTPSSFGMGLFKENELICGMIFRRPYRGGGWEISRFCSKSGYKVYGGASKILKRWEKGLLVTYSNNRFSNGDVYKSIGFEEISSSNDFSYYYTDFEKRIWRFKCRKINKPEVKKYTERKQAKMGLFSKHFNHSNPVYRIYDLGQRKWMFSKSTENDDRLVQIYKFTDPKNKIYIGISYDAEHRKYQHISDPNGALYKPIKKYGIENMKFEIIATAFGRTNAEYLEKKIISQYNSYRKGYNRTDGGEGCSGGKKLTAEIVSLMKKELKNTELSYRALGKKYGVAEVTIRRIASGKIWSHVEPKIKINKKKGVTQESSKLKIKEVKEIKKMLRDGYNRKNISNKFNVKLPTIDAIASGRNWAHVKVKDYKEKSNQKYTNKLNWDLVKKIRKEFKEGKKQIELSKKYNLSRNTIANVVKNRTWKE